MRSRTYKACGHIVTFREVDGGFMIGNDGDEEFCDNVRACALAMGGMLDTFIFKDMMNEAVAEGWDFFKGTRKEVSE